MPSLPSDVSARPVDPGKGVSVAEGRFETLNQAAWPLCQRWRPWCGCT